MRRYEQMKLFSGGDSASLEKKYNEWYKQKKDERDGHTALSNLPLVILDRKLIIRNYKGAETYALAIFYDDYLLDEHEKGSKDRAGNFNGASMFTQK